jgi:hypothetical protein
MGQRSLHSCQYLGQVQVKLGKNNEQVTTQWTHSGGSFSCNAEAVAASWRGSTLCFFVQWFGFSTMSDPATILGILQFVGAAAMRVCQVIDKALEVEREERQALKNLRRRVKRLKSDTIVYKLLLNSMENDTDLNGRSPYTRFIQRYAPRLRSTS